MVWRFASHPLQWITNKPLKRYKNGRSSLVPPFHLYRERCMSNKAFFMGEGYFYICLKMETEVEHVWLVWNYSAGVPVDTVVRSRVVEEAEGRRWMGNHWGQTLSNTKKSFLPSLLLSLLFRLLNWLSPPGTNQWGPLESVRRRSYCRGSLTHMLARSIWHKQVLCQQHLQMRDL